MSESPERSGVTWWPAWAAAAIGLVASMVVAWAVGIPRGDAIILMGIAFGVSVFTLAVGSAVLWGLRARGHGAERGGVVLVAVIPVVSLAAGALVAARAMFVSTHDLRALAVVLAGAGTAGVVGALIVARALAESRRRLEEATATQARVERSRRELVAWVSHDLRTPLAGIRAMSEALVDGVVSDPATVDNYHRRIQREMERLTQLVDDLFELSRIEVEAVRLTLEPVSLEDLVSDAIASADPVARARGVTLTGRVDGPSPVLDLSSPEMLRVVHNLLDNAIRHTPSGGSVSVDVRTTPTSCAGVGERSVRRDRALRSRPHLRSRLPVRRCPFSVDRRGSGSRPRDRPRLRGSPRRRADSAERR